MKKNWMLCIACVMILSLSAFAGGNTNVKIAWGEDYSLPKKHEDLGFFGNPADGYIDISHQRNKDITIQHFTTDLKLTNESSVSIKDLPKNYMIDKILKMGDKYYLFYSTYDDEEMLWEQELDVKKGELKDKPKQIASSKNKIAGRLMATGLYQMQVTDKWQFLLSADESKLLIYYRLKPKEKKDALSYDIIGLYVFDNKISKLWNKEVTMPYTEKMMDNDDYQVDKSGNAYILGKVYEDGNKDSKDGHPNYHYELLVYSGSTNGNVAAKFDFGEKYVVDAALIEDQNGRIICSGYYSNDKKARSTDGVFFMSFDESTHKMINIFKGFYEFPSDVIKQFESKRTQRKAEKDEQKGKDLEVAHLEFRNLVVSDDGSFSLFGEQYYTTTVSQMAMGGTGGAYGMGGYSPTSFGNRGTTSQTRYYYDDIYAMRIGPDGELAWVKKIPKRQMDMSSVSTGSYGYSNFRANTDYLSFFLHTVGSNNYLFFIDDQKNLNLAPDQVPAMYHSGARGELVCVKIDDKGNTTKSSIFDFKEEKMKILISKFNSVTQHDIIGRARDTKGMLQFNFSDGKALKISVN